MIQIIKGKVIKGNQLGRTIGFPTANIECISEYIDDGVYKINIIIDNIIYSGAGVFRKKINIFESFIFNFDKDIYGKNIEVILLEKIREYKKVSSLEEIKELITNDVKKIKNMKNTVLTFGTFDFVHKGHENFLKQAKKYGDNLITILATDKNVEKFKGKSPKYNINERINHIKALNISDEVVEGFEKKPLKWLDIYTPKIVCLGYDQKGFSDVLREYIKSNKLNIEIVRLEPYKNDIYKSSLLKKTTKSKI